MLERVDHEPERALREQAHVRPAVRLARLQRDRAFRNARYGKTGMTGRIAVAIAGRAGRPGFGKAPTGLESPMRGARQQQRIRFRGRAHPGHGGIRDIHQHFARQARVDDRTADEIRRGAWDRKQAGGDEAAGGRLGNRNRLVALLQE